MSSADDINYIVKLANDMYSSVRQEERQFAEEELKKIKNNGQLLLSIFSQTRDQYALIFASLSIVQWFVKEKEKLQKSDAQSIISTVFSAAHYLHSISAVRHVLTSVVDCVCRLTKLTFDKEENAVTFVIDKCLSELNAQSSPEEVHFVLTVLIAMVQEMSLYNGSKNNSYLTFAVHRRSSNNFRDMCMLSIFTASIDQLGRVESHLYPSCAESVQLVRHCLTYDFMAIIVDETDEAISTQFPSAWKDFLLNNRTQDILWKNHHSLPLPYCLHLIQGLGALCGTRRSFFDNQTEKENFLFHLLAKLCEIENIPDNRLNDSDYCAAIGEASHRLVGPYGYKELRLVKNFDEWVNFLRSLTVRVFSAPFGDAFSFHTTTIMLRFWTRIVSSKKLYVGAQDDRPKDLETVQPQIAMAFVLSRISPNIREFEEDVTETMQIESELFTSVCVYESHLLVEQISSHTKSVASALLSANNANKSVNGNTRAIHTTGMSWLFYLGGEMVRKLYPNMEESAVPAYSQFLALLVEAAKALRDNWTQITQEEALFVEGALSHFLNALQCVFSANRLNDQLIKIMINVFETKANLFQFFLSSIGHNILRPIKLINGGCDEYSIVKQAIDIIREVCNDVPCEITSQINLSLPPVVQLPLSQRVETFKLRTNLYAALWALRAPEEYTYSFFQEFIAPIEQVIEYTSSGQDTSPLFVSGWLRDLRGVARAVAAVKQPYTDFIDWVLDHSEIFYHLSSLPNPPLITISLLRFVCELVTPSSAYSKLLISTSSHSVTGVLLFKFICKVVQNVLNSSINEEMVRKVESGQVGAADGAYEYMLKPIYLCMTIICRCIEGDFVPFGAMSLYNDNCYEVTVSGMFRLLAVFPFFLFSQYGKATKAVMELLRTMTESSVYSPLAIMPPHDLLVLIEFAISIVNDIDTPTQTLLYVLAFLTFIANLIKPTKAILERRQREAAAGTTNSPRIGGISSNNCIINSIIDSNRQNGNGNLLNTGGVLLSSQQLTPSNSQTASPQLSPLNFSSVNNTSNSNLNTISNSFCNSPGGSFNLTPRNILSSGIVNNNFINSGSNSNSSSSIIINNNNNNIGNNNCGNISGNPGNVIKSSSSSSKAGNYTRNTRNVREQIAESLIPFVDLWEKLITMAMNTIVTQDRALTSCTQIVFPIFEADMIFWTNFAEKFISSYPAEKRPMVAKALTSLGNEASTQDKFFSEIFVFRAAIRKL